MAICKNTKNCGKKRNMEGRESHEVSGWGGIPKRGEKKKKEQENDD